MHNVLVTCPPMLRMFEEFIEPARKCGLELIRANVIQAMTENALIKELPKYDGWIIGDDPATKPVFVAGKKGHLKAAVKWGIGIDNVDFSACQELGIPISNTPNMFGGEVADLAIGYLLALARQTFFIDREIRNLGWPKPAGISVTGKRVGIVGFGNIGQNIIKRLSGFDVKATVYDPGKTGNYGFAFVERKEFPDGLDELDFLVFTCELNKLNVHMLNAETIYQLKPGVSIINVARGSLIDESSLIVALESGHISAVALDVFEVEPLPENSSLRTMPQCILGSHNGSNTKEGVRRATAEAVRILAEFLHGK